MMKPTDFASKLFAVTGAAQGIGAAITQALLDRDAIVAALDICADTLQAFRDRIASPRLHTYCLDVSSHSQVKSIINCLESDLGPIVGWINVAGILTPKSILETTPDDWERTFAVNTTGVFNACQCVAQVMVPRCSGAIVTVSSNAASVPRQNMAAYAASKAAATQFTRCLGLELAEFGIRCNIVSPGSTDTPMQRSLWSNATDDVPDAVLQGSLSHFRIGIPLRRIASPEDVADAVLFLLSDRARHITLHDLRIDGGATLGA